MTIHDAIMAGDASAVRRYIAAGHDLEVHDALKRTPLVIALGRGQSAIARLLLDAGADALAVDYRKYTALQRRCMTPRDSLRKTSWRRCSAQAAIRLLEMRFKARLCTSSRAAPPAKNRIAIIERLLDAGAPLDALDSSERTPLWNVAATSTTAFPAAVMKARLSVLKHLLASGADPTRKAAGSMGTPLDAARGLHQAKRHRIVWPEAVSLLEKAVSGGLPKRPTRRNTTVTSPSSDEPGSPAPHTTRHSRSTPTPTPDDVGVLVVVEVAATGRPKCNSCAAMCAIEVHERGHALIA